MATGLMARGAVVATAAWWLLLGNMGIVNASSDSNVNVTGIDPIDNYCVRTSHQSTIQNDMLFIDGGIMSFSNFVNGNAKGPKVIGYNEYLIAVNMSTSWDWKTNISISKHEKGPNPQTGTYTGSYIRGSLFAGPLNSNAIYQFGGTTDFTNKSFSGFGGVQSDQYPLWSYDTKNYDVSGQYDLSTESITRPYAGAWTEASVLGLGFYFNGAINNGSALQTDKLENGEIFLPGMIVLDLNNQTAVNLSTSDVTPNARVRGSMVYIQELGEMGALVMMGGGERPGGVNKTDFKGNLVPMSEIDIYDVASYVNGGGSNGNTNGTWYKQTATGDPKKGLPDPRMDFCVVALMAQDYSSYNLYLYGGRDDTSKSGFDELWILSMPSFTWTFVYQGKSPRFGMTCHTVAGNKMLTVGGFQSTNLTETCDWEAKGVAIYDTGLEDWGSVYNATNGQYTPPPLLIHNIGGSATGGATATAPKGGWNNTDLEKLFTQANKGNFTSLATAHNFSSNSNSTSSTKSSVDSGAIAGGVIGAVGGLAALIGLGFYFKRRNARTPQRIGYVAEKDGEVHAAEMDGKPDPRYELDNVKAGQLRNEGPWPAEKIGDIPRPPVDPAELPTQRYSGAAELPAAGFHHDENGHQDDDDVRPEPLPKDHSNVI